MKAKSITATSTGEVQHELQEAMADGFKPTLAVIFISKKLNHRSVCKVLDDAGIKIFGATTNGEFINEETHTGSAAILLMDLNPAYFTIIFDEFPERDYRKKSSEAAKKARELFTNPAFLLSCSNTATDAEELLMGFADVVGKHVNVYGGAAGDDYSFSEQIVFTNSKESKEGMVVLALDEDKITIKGRAICGWKAVGTERTVTRSEGNHVYTVDDIPVLDLTAKYGGIENVSPDNTNLMLEIASTLPLQLQKEKGDPVMRPGLQIDWSDHSFYCSGSVPQGSKVRFSLPPDFDVMEKVIRGLEELKETEMPEADALVVFSCAGRIISFGPMMNMEIEGIKNIWNVPLAGMFSNAELCRTKGGDLEMQNLTTCCVALKEN